MHSACWVSICQTPRWRAQRDTATSKPDWKACWSYTGVSGRLSLFLSFFLKNFFPPANVVPLGQMPCTYKWSREVSAGWESTARLPGNVVECLLGSLRNSSQPACSPVWRGRVGGLLALEPGAQVDSQIPCSQSLITHALSAWFSSLSCPLRPSLFLTLDPGSMSPSPGYSSRVPGGSTSSWHSRCCPN